MKDIKDQVEEVLQLTQETLDKIKEDHNSGVLYKPGSHEKVIRLADAVDDIRHLLAVDEMLKRIKNGIIR